jgi:hypothetical protein
VNKGESLDEHIDQKRRRFLICSCTCDSPGVYPSSVAHPGMTEKTPMDDELRDRLAIRDLIEN